MSNYKSIVGPNTVNTGVKQANVYTVPKSGSAFISIFFHVYQLLLGGKNVTQQDLVHNFLSQHAFGKSQFFIEHSDCPGFQEVIKNPKMLALWNQLQYPDPVWAGNPERKKIIAATLARIANHPQSADQGFLNKLKIVLLFRNPLDEFISLYGSQNINPANLMPTIDAYIKIFYTFHIVRQVFPTLILMVPYEYLMQNKAEALTRILNHLGITYNEKAFYKTIALTSIENLSALEKKIGYSLLTHGKIISGSRHIKDGATGKWQKFLSPDQVRQVEAKMNQFGLSLTMFDLGEDIDPKYNFLFQKSTTQQKLRV